MARCTRLSWNRRPENLSFFSLLMVAAVSTVACGGSTVSELSGPTPAARCDTAVSGIPPVVDASGAQLQISVVTSRDCVWSMSGNAAWLQLSPRNGQGEQTVTLVVAANGSSSSRVAAVTINDRTVNIVQDAAPPPPPPPAPAPAEPGAPAPVPSPTPAPPPETAPVRVDRIQLDGRVGDLAGSCPTLSFSVQGRSVVTDAHTRFTGGNCRSLRNGREVEVDGDLYSDGTVRATRVGIDD